jgi:thymidylate synthase (FAD)
MVIIMNNFATPQLYLLSRPTFDVGAFLAFLSRESLTWRRTQSATEAEEIVEAAGRICYMSFGANQSPRDNFEYIQNLIRMGHDSVLEHVSWTILITGVSRAFTHQLVRHRVGFAFSQLSQQYHDERDAAFIMPTVLEGVPHAVQTWSDAMDSAKRAYEAIIAALQQSKSPVLTDLNKKETQRAIRSAARSVLPQATETKIIVTANARAVRHLLKTRGSIPGDLEMRQVCTELLKVLKPEAPSLFFDFELQTFSDEFPAVVQIPEEKLSLVS